MTTFTRVITAVAADAGCTPSAGITAMEKASRTPATAAEPTPAATTAAESRTDTTEPFDDAAVLSSHQITVPTAGVVR